MATLRIPTADHLRMFFEQYVRKHPGLDACWEFTGTLGAVTIIFPDKVEQTMLPERLVFLYMHGHAEETLDIIRVCGNTRCCRPEHLAARPRAEEPHRKAQPTALVSHREAANLVGTTSRAIIRAIRSGDLPGRFVSQRAGYRISRDALLSWASCAA